MFTHTTLLQSAASSAPCWKIVALRRNTTRLWVYRALQVLSWLEARLKQFLFIIIQEIQPKAPGSPENARSRKHKTMENRCHSHDQCRQVIPGEYELHTSIITSSTCPFSPRKFLAYFEDSGVAILFIYFRGLFFSFFYSGKVKVPIC